MAKTKANKKQRTGGKGEKKEEQGSGTNITQLQNDSPPKPSVVIDISSHPYILERILAYSSPSTLALLLRLSKDIFQAAAPALYSTLRLTHQQFAAMIEEGNAPSKRGSSSGLLGRSFSPYLRECLKNTRVIQLLGYQEDVAIPPLPRGSFGRLSRTIIYPADVPVTRSHWRRHILALSLTGLDPLRSTDLVIRLDTERSRYSRYRFVNLLGITKTLTIIIPFSLRLTYIPTIHFDNPQTSVQVVLLPPARNATSGWSELFAGRVNPDTEFAQLGRKQPAYTLVGGEYLAVDPARFTAPASTYIRKGGGIRGFTPFASWLDTQEAEGIFTAEEEDELREADRAERARLEADGKVF